MAPMTGKMPLILRSVVPAIPKEPGERAYLEEDLTRIGCIRLLNKPWSVKDERMVRELILGAPNQYEGTVRARPETWDAGRWREPSRNWRKCPAPLSMRSNGWNWPRPSIISLGMWW